MADLGSRIGSRWEDGSDHHFTVPVRRDRFYVYIAWGADRARPLYVGKANNIFSRFGTHLHQAPWTHDVIEVECFGFHNEGAAYAAESEAIHALNPIHNRVLPLTASEKERRRAEGEARREAREEQRRRDEAFRRSGPPPIFKVVTRRADQPKRRVKILRRGYIPPDQLAIIKRVQDRGLW